MNFLLIPLGAFLWRLRGGLLNDLTGRANWMGCNDTVVRLFWSGGMTGGYWLVHHLPALNTLALFLALFAGTTLVGWLGADVQLTHLTPRGLLLVSISGTLRMVFVAAALLSPWPLVVGILCGPIYWAASKLPHPYNWMFWGEILFGAAIGADLCLVSYLPT